MKSGERWQWVKLPMEWTSSGTQYTSMGAIGYVKSGGAVFDHRSSPFGDLASCHEWISLDPSHGHSDPSKQYHYHGVRTYLGTIHIKVINVGSDTFGNPIFRKGLKN